MYNFLKKTGEILSDLVYPLRCPICDGILSRGDFVCKTCRPKLPFITTGRCRICGKPVEEGEELCEDCKIHSHLFRSGMGLFLYDETMKNTMAALKYKGRREYGTALGGLLYEYSKDRLRLWKPEVIVPVPVHPDRERIRGYNQAEVIARSLSGYAGIPVSSKAVVRCAGTAAMKGLSAEQRKDNLKSAFAAGVEPVREKSVLLIDDIMTTGATLDAVSAVLLKEGADDIRFLTVCIGKGFMLQY